MARQATSRSVQEEQAVPQTVSESPQFLAANTDGEFKHGSKPQQKQKTRQALYA